MQVKSSPVFPQLFETSEWNSDLISYQLANTSDTIFTAHGIDIPRRSNDETLGPEWDVVYNFVGTGNLAPVSNSCALLSWGYDNCGVGCLVIYETPVDITGAPSALVIESRSDKGPSRDTLHTIYDALRGLGNEEVTSLVDETEKLVQNGARNGLAPIQCDAGCVNNTGASV